MRTFNQVDQQTKNARPIHLNHKRSKFKPVMELILKRKKHQTMTLLFVKIYL